MFTVFQPKLTADVLLKFSGGQLELLGQSCHYRGQIARIVCGLDANNVIESIQIYFRWLAEKKRKRFIPKDVLRCKKENFSLIFVVMNVKSIEEEELVVISTYDEKLIFISEGSASIVHPEF